MHPNRFRNGLVNTDQLYYYDVSYLNVFEEYLLRKNSLYAVDILLVGIIRVPLLSRRVCQRGITASSRQIPIDCQSLSVNTWRVLQIDPRPHCVELLTIGGADWLARSFSANMKHFTIAFIILTNFSINTLCHWW